MCRESHPLWGFKNPSQIYIWLFVDFHPAPWSVQSISADNALGCARQYIEKKRLYASLAVINLNYVIPPLPTLALNIS